MAIQIPNPGTGNGATGDNEFVLWSKVRDNFTNTTHAASRLVGTDTGNLMQVGTFGLGSNNNPILDYTTLTSSGLYAGAGTIGTNYPVGAAYAQFIYGAFLRMRRVNTQFTLALSSLGVAYSVQTGGAETLVTHKIYGTNNTTVDSNGLLKPSSPVLRVFSDRIEGNTDADVMQAVFTKNGVGDYSIANTTGLRTDGWYITIPNDMNGNPKVAVTLSEVDGVISLKTYKRIFSMETFTFEPDLDNPLDIPDTRWIDLRLNEIPVEMPDDIQPEV